MLNPRLHAGAFTLRRGASATARSRASRTNRDCETLSCCAVTRTCSASATGTRTFNWVDPPLSIPAECIARCRHDRFLSPAHVAGKTQPRHCHSESPTADRPTIACDMTRTCAQPCQIDGWSGSRPLRITISFTARRRRSTFTDLEPSA